MEGNERRPDGTNGGIVNKAYDGNVIVQQPANNGQAKIVDTYKNDPDVPSSPGEPSADALTPPPMIPEGKSFSDLVFEELDRSQNLATSSHHHGTSFFSVPDAVDHPIDLPKPDPHRKPTSPPLPPLPAQEKDAEDIFASLDCVSADLPRDDLYAEEAAPAAVEEDGSGVYELIVEDVEEVPISRLDVSAICKGGIVVETGEKCTRSQLKGDAEMLAQQVPQAVEIVPEEQINIAAEESIQEGEPVQEEPVQEEPVQEEPVQEEPVQEEPVQEERVQEEPVQEERVQEEPVQEEPVQQESIQQQESKQEVIEKPPQQDKMVEEQNPVLEEEPKQSEEKEKQTVQEETPQVQLEEQEISSNIQEGTTSSQDTIPQEVQVDGEGTKQETTATATTVWRDRLARELLEDDVEFCDVSTDDEEEETRARSSSSPSVTSQSERRRALVIDNGSWEVRSGFSGKFSPDARTRNVIGRWRRETGEAWRGQPDSRFYGDDAIQKHSTLTLQYLIKDGAVCDWRDMMAMWNVIIDDELDADITQHPVVVSEPVGVDRKQRERMLEILVESMRASGVLLRSQAQLALYSQQAESGLVVNCGHSGTQVAPIYRGYQLDYGCSFLDVGGQEITDQLSRLVQNERGVTFASVGEMEAVNSIKENYAYVADATEKHHAEKQEVILPDGRPLEVDKELWMCTEALFQPNLAGSSSPGLHQLVIDSIKKLPANTLRNERGEIEVVLAGGTGTKLDGLAERLQFEVDSLLTSTSDDVITVKIANCGADAAWVGGSLLADQDEDFERLLVDEKSYSEHGSKIVHRMF